MMRLKFLKVPGLILTMAGCFGLQAQMNSNSTNGMQMTAQQQATKGFYDFQVKTLIGDDFNLADLKGKRVLVVNTASECGFTPQYAQLQELFEKYGGEDFVIIGFPSNDFGGQEPGSDAEIAQFCQMNYGVTFPMMSKISVKGKDQHPLYAWLTNKSLNGVSDAKVKWNFNKFLIDEKGNWVADFGSTVKPLDDRIVTFATGKKW